jgi:hypothetical protein
MKTLQLALSLCCLLLIVTAASAQFATGSLSGTVTDTSGAVLAGARVVATNTGTGRSYELTTSGAGLYAFPNLIVGTYTVTVEQSGFKKLTRNNIVIGTATTSVVDISLEVGDLSQSVQVTTDAPLLQTQTSEIGVNFAPKLFKDAPLFVGGGFRNPESFITYMPGVNNGSGDSSINGGNRRSKEILIDGAGNTNPESGGVSFNFPAVEQFGEFKLLTNNFAAEYGRTGGGVEIFTTASGTNAFHGSLYDFHRNSVLDATPWATKASPLRNTLPVGDPRRPVKSKYRQNEFGFAIGGPIYLPKKIFGPLGGYNENKQKTFFFFTYNGYRQNALPTVLTGLTLPTLKMRQGDFSELPVPIFDPLTGRQFPGNIIPQNRFSAVSRAILPLIPQPDTPTLQANWTGTRVQSQRNNTWSLKVNHNITDKHRVDAWISEQEVNGPFIDGPLPHPLFGGNQVAINSNKPRFWRFNYDYSITPRLNLHATYGITQFRQFFDSPSVGVGWPEKIGLKGVAKGETDAFPAIFFENGGYLNYGDTNGPKTKGTQFNYTDHVRLDASWLKGNHQIKFGWDKRWMRTTGKQLSTGGFDDAGVQGQFFFSRDQTADPARLGTTGDAFASFLLGQVRRTTRNFTAAAATARFGYNAAYAQTDWKVRSNLTLNLGFRYEIPIPRSTDPDFGFTSFDPNLTNPGANNVKGALAFAGDCQGCTGKKRFAEIDYSSYGPRLGFAWGVDQKTVVRGGYGIYYGAGNGLTGGFCLGCSFGLGASPEFVSPGGTAAAINWDNGFPTTGFALPPFITPSGANYQSPWYISPDSGKAPRIHNYNLSIQREFKKYVFELTYAGSRGFRLAYPRDPLNVLDPKYLSLGALLNRRIDDPAVIAAGFTKPFPSFPNNLSLGQALKPFPQFISVPNEYDPKGKSWYDSLQFVVQRRYSDVTLQASYVFSKSLTDASGTQTSSNGTSLNPRSQNPYDDAHEKTYLYTDWPHVVNVVWSWDLPFGKKLLNTSNPVLSRLVGGWTLSGVHQYRSGSLILINAPNAISAFYERKRPNLTGQPIRTGIDYGDLDPNDSNTRLFNKSAFAVPGDFEFGNAANYLTDLRNPPIFSENFGIIKRTRIKEQSNFEFRAEIINPFNRTRFGGINVDISPANQNFGRPTGPQLGARIIQLVAKLNF